MSDADDGDVPGWRRLLGNENLWVAVAAAVILAFAFYLATRR